MRNSVLLMSICFGVAVFAGCGGSANVNSSTASNASKGNANQTTAASTPTAVDTTPVKMSVKDITSADKAKSMVGKTLVFKTEIIKSWSEDSLNVKYSNGVICKGDFSSYKDAITAFQTAKDFVYVDFKGVGESVEESDGSVFLKLKDCSIQNIEK